MITLTSAICREVWNCNISLFVYFSIKFINWQLFGKEAVCLALNRITSKSPTTVCISLGAIINAKPDFWVALSPRIRCFRFEDRCLIAKEIKLFAESLYYIFVEMFLTSLLHKTEWEKTFHGIIFLSLSRFEPGTSRSWSGWRI